MKSLTRELVNKNQLLVLLSIILSSYYAFSQDFSKQDIDQLNQQAINCDSIGYEAILKLREYYYYLDDHDQLQIYTQQEVNCAKKSSDRYKMMDAFYHLVLYHQSASGRDSVAEVAEELLSFIGNDTTDFAQRTRTNTLFQIARHYNYDHDDIDKAYSYYQNVKDIADRRQYYGIYLKVVVDLANYYTYDNEYEKAINIANEAIAKIENISYGESPVLKKYLDQLKYYRTQALINGPKSDSSDLAEAYKFLKEKLKNDEKHNRLYFVADNITLIIGGLSSYLPTDTLLFYGRKGIELNKSFSRKDHYMYRFHGVNLIKAGQYREAQQVLETALDLALNQENWFYEIALTYKYLAKTHLYLDEKLKAEQRYELFETYQDSTYIRKNKTAVETVEAKYALRQQETENTRIAQEAELLSERLKLIITIGILLFLSLILSLVFYFVQHNNAQKLMHLNEMKNKIFTILGHDLRAPSLAFNNLSKNLSYLIKNNDPDKLLKLADVYEERGRQLSRIINNVLSWAITENDSFLNTPERVSLFAVIRESLENFDWDLVQKNIAVKVDIPEEEVVIFDTNALSIINKNLLHNAIKFSPLNASVRIKYDKQKKILEYIDEGAGIDEEVIKKMTKGVPVKSSLGTQNEKGIGIGLLTCLKLLQLNKADISILTNSPTGTIIRLKFA